jgi:peroxiredoxin Q/BCP
MLKTGQPAPDFHLPGHDGKIYSLSGFKGKFVVLYFYPKDMTSGCTTEACEFRDRHDDLIRRKAVVIGVSPDPLQKHVQFIDKHQLPYLLLSDEDHKTAKAYKVWGKKKMYGREYEGILRTTFIIDPNGIIIRIFEKVKVTGHAGEVLAALQP